MSIGLLNVRAAAYDSRFSHRKAKVMEFTSILRGGSLTRLLQGAAAGAAVTMIVGFIHP
jgi:hypothetical protein